jgi:hypothetical protein
MVANTRHHLYCESYHKSKLRYKSSQVSSSTRADNNLHFVASASFNGISRPNCPPVSDMRPTMVGAPLIVSQRMSPTLLRPKVRWRCIKCLRCAIAQDFRTLAEACITPLWPGRDWLRTHLGTCIRVFGAVAWGCPFRDPHLQSVWLTRQAWVFSSQESSDGRTGAGSAAGSVLA